MAEYIDRESIYKILLMENPFGWNNDDLAELFREAKAADVEPVKHGRWIYREFDDEYGWRQEYECSECSKYSYFDTDYCPNCGARMHEEVKHER